MADDIYNGNYMGDVPAWHGKGVIKWTQFTAAEVLAEGGFDYSVVKVPLFTEDGQQINNSFATIREDLPTGDNDRILGVVGPRYTVVQNVDAFAFFNDIVGEGKAIYTSAGILGHGERTFLVARIPHEFYVAKDKFEEYVVLNNSHDGSYALRIMTVAVRVVCQNTLSMALRSYKSCVALRHTTNVHSKMLDASDLLGLADKQFQETQKLFNALVQKPLSHPLFTQYVEELFPSENPNKTTLAHREGVTVLLGHEYNSAPGIKHTWHAASQAVIQYVDHAMPTRKDKFEQALFGSGAILKRKAVKLAYEYSKRGK